MRKEDYISRAQKRNFWNRRIRSNILLMTLEAEKREERGKERNLNSCPVTFPRRRELPESFPMLSVYFAAALCLCRRTVSFFHSVSLSSKTLNSVNSILFRSVLLSSVVVFSNLRWLYDHHLVWQQRRRPVVRMIPPPPPLPQPLLHRPLKLQRPKEKQLLLMPPLPPLRSNHQQLELQVEVPPPPLRHQTPAQSRKARRRRRRRLQVKLLNS